MPLPVYTVVFLKYIPRYVRDFGEFYIGGYGMKAIMFSLFITKPTKT